MRPGSSVKILSDESQPTGVVIAKHDNGLYGLYPAWRVLCRGRVLIVFEDELEVVK